MCVACTPHSARILREPRTRDSKDLSNPAHCDDSKLEYEGKES